LQTLLWPDEVREMRFHALPNPDPADETQLRAAQALAHALSGDFDPNEHTDEYQTELKRLLEDATTSGKPAPTGSLTSPPGRDVDVEDLIAALRRSVDSATVEPPADT
jgi:DNA end-binding protein Ku